jgi:hypothetical protein
VWGAQVRAHGRPEGHAGRLSQAADFACHYSETTAMFTGPSSLNGGIQSQQICLLTDVLDNIYHLTDFYGAMGQ